MPRQLNYRYYALNPSILALHYLMVFLKIDCFMHILNKLGMQHEWYIRSQANQHHT
jgi:hypothetical protein